MFPHIAALSPKSSEIDLKDMITVTMPIMMTITGIKIGIDTNIDINIGIGIDTNISINTMPLSHQQTSTHECPCIMTPLSSRMK